MNVGKSKISVRIRENNKLPQRYLCPSAMIELTVVEDFILTDGNCNSIINMAVNEKTIIMTNRNPRELRFSIIQDDDLIEIDFSMDG